MNWYKTAKSENIEEPTKEMIEFFNKRTSQHINLVQKYCKMIEELDPNKFKGLTERGEEHDASKFKEPERTPYIFITWDYKLKDEGKKLNVSDEMREKMNKASETHCSSNKHHAENHCKNLPKEVINKKNRDKPHKEMLDCTSMTNPIDISEMVADWLGMGEEKGNTAKSWADKNINIRWKFSKEAKDLIYDIINKIEKSI